MTTRRTVYWLLGGATSASLLLASACGSGAQRKIGSLAAPTRPEILAAFEASDDVPWPPLVSESRLDRGCSEVSRVTALELGHLEDVPKRAGTPLCYVEGADPHSEDDLDGLEPWWAHVLYVPEDIDLTRASYREVLDAGGIDVIFDYSPTEAQPPEKGDPGSADGGYEPATIGGSVGLIQRTRPNRVTANWTIKNASRSEGARSHIEVTIAGDYTADQIATMARDLRPGIPPLEHTPVSGSPDAASENSPGPHATPTGGGG